MHQFSYKIPYVLRKTKMEWKTCGSTSVFKRLWRTIMGQPSRSVYRLCFRPAIATRAFGAGVVGYEFNLPLSKIVSKRWTLHFNAGMSMFPYAHQSHHLTNYNVGARAIYAMSKDFNLMPEALAGWNEDIAEGVFAFEE